jgi:hypothetical protein
VRVLVNYMLRKETWFVHAIATDAQTAISPVLPVPDQVTLIRLLRYIGAGHSEIDEEEDRSMVARYHLDQPDVRTEKPPTHPTHPAAMERQGWPGLIIEMLREAVDHGR